MATTTKSGSYKDGDAASIKSGGTYKTVLNAGYDKFTLPLVGGFDGFDILVPDLYNAGMTSATETNNSSYYSLQRDLLTPSQTQNQ